MRLREIDDQVTYAQQLQHDDGPVVLINQFTLAPGDAEQFPQLWADDAAFMKQQPGFISTQLHRGTAGSTAYVNVAVWESAQSLAPGVQHPPVPGPPRPLPRHQHRSPAPVHQGPRPRHLTRLTASRSERPRRGPLPNAPAVMERSRIPTSEHRMPWQAGRAPPGPGCPESGPVSTASGLAIQRGFAAAPARLADK